jgi:probable phosphoglycerate mutase
MEKTRADRARGVRVVTTFYLVRHAAHDLVDRVLAGRKIDIGLNEHGIRQAKAIGRRLADEPIDQVLSSPRKRARETAEPIATAHGLLPVVASQIDEHDAGLWSGQDFDSLSRDPRWRLWNEHRAKARPPAGESMRELQIRIVGYLVWLAARHPNDRIVIVTHAEPIRAVLLHERRLPVDAFMQIDVPLASVTILSRASAPSPAAERA